VVASISHDPLATLQARRRQIVEFARYGRQSVFEWDDVDVNEFHAYHMTLIELLNEEHPDSIEDH
jgi:hypothetical protein